MTLPTLSAERTTLNRPFEVRCPDGQRVELRSNPMVHGMIDLLEYSLGEGIVLDTALTPDLPAVRVDPGQLEKARMNLAPDACDAMQGTSVGIRLPIAAQPEGAGESVVPSAQAAGPFRAVVASWC